MSGDGDSGAELAMNQSLTSQKVVLNGSDEQNSYAIYGRDVLISSSAVDESVKGSNKVKISPIVSYDWAVKHYNGRQVAIDRTQKYVAYALKSRTGGIVRLIHRELAERALIKCYTGLVVDIAFAHSDNDVLASMDDNSTLFIHKIELDGASHVVTTCLLQLSWQTADIDMRVIWCLHIPDVASCDDDSDDEDKTMLLSTVIDCKVYVMNVLQLANEHGVGPHHYQELSGSIVEISKHTKKVVSVSFSPDGAAIATASEDGNACFYEVDLSNGSNSPRCLYEWSPHDGQPISLLAFLDNHLDADPDCQYWKYAVTGCNNNTELKVWTCAKWRCLQTLRFTSPDDEQPSCLIANIDLTSRYLIMSDISRRVLYILKLIQDVASSAAHVSSISEFILGAPCLSFAIMDIRRKQMFSGNDSDDEDDDDDEFFSNGANEEQRYRSGISVHLAAVQPKHLQDMTISFTPLTSTLTDSVPSSTATSSSDVVIAPDGLSELSVSTSGAVSRSADTPTPPALTAAIVQAEEMAKLSSGGQPLGIPATSYSLQSLGTVVGDHSSSSVASTPAVSSARSSVLLTPEAFTSLSPKPHTSMVSPASGRSSLTHVTQLQDNSSLVIGPSAFDAGSASSVSSRTITPRTSSSGVQVGEKLATTGSPLAGAQATGHESQLTPSSMPLPASSGSTPSLSEPSAPDDTARQLEELFDSFIDHNTGMMPDPQLRPMADIPLLTEADILKGSTEPGSANHEGVAKGQRMPQTIPPTSSPYDIKIWPKPPEPPTEKLDPDTGATDESDTTEETDDDNASTGSDKESMDEELSVKDIERDVEKEEAIEQRRKSSEPITTTTVMSAAAGPNPVEMQEKFTAHLEDVKASILTLNEMMMTQGRDIHHLKCAGGSDQKMDKLIKQVQMLNSTMTSKLENTVSSLKREQKSAQDRLLSQTASKLTQEVKSQVEKVVIAEMKKTVIPALHQMVDPVKKDLLSLMTDKLTAADVTFKDSITKLVHSQSTTDKLAHSVGMVVHDAMQTAHRDSLSQQVLPSFDASIRQAFAQLNTAFSDGLNNYMKQLNENMDKVRSKQMNTQTIVTASCENAVETLTQTAAEVQKHITVAVQKEIQQQVTLAMESVKPHLVRDLQTAVKAELGPALDRHQKVLSEQLEDLRSAASTPAPDPHTSSAAIKAQIERRLAAADYEQAFQSALSASDLSIVMHLLCKLPDSCAVLTEPCPLSQPTLLSLIQQLSLGLSGSHLDLKFDYLADAVINLDPHDTITQQHMGSVIAIVKEKLAEFIAKNPNSAHKRTVSAIEKSLKSILKYVKA